MAIGILSSLLNVYLLALLVWVVLSWIRTPWSQDIRDQTSFLFEPLLAPIRQLLDQLGAGPVKTGIDLSPLILYFALTFVMAGLARVV